MKKKSVRAIAFCLLMIAALLGLSGCGSRSKTLSQFLDSNNRVIGYYFTSNSGIAKDDLTEYVFVFENDELTIYKYVWLKFGDIASMSDDEVIQYCIEDCDSDDIETYDTYRIAAYTDKTGNNIYAEGVQVLRDDGTYIFPISYAPYFGVETYQIYDSEFVALGSYDDLINKNIYLAFKDAPYLEFDTTKSKEIVIDP